MLNARAKKGEHVSGLRRRCGSAAKSPRSAARYAFAWLVLVLAANPFPARAHTCGTSSASDCTKNRDRACTVTCDETDLRNAVDVVNQCGGHRTLTFSFPPCSGSCTIAMLNQSSTASCGEHSNAICLTGDSMTIDGANGSGVAGATFKYTGPYKCASCSGSCSGPQPALFVVKGSDDTVRNLVMNFFSEDIQIEGPTRDTVDGLQSSYYCEEALTINSGTKQRARYGVFTGATDPEAANAGGVCYKERAAGTGSGSAIACTKDSDCHGSCSGSGANCSKDSDCAGETCKAVPSQQCHCANGYFASETINGGSCAPASSGTCYRKALCGLDKAIQINGGDGEVVSNTFHNALTPVLVSNGLGPASAYIVDHNQIIGSQVDLALSTEPTFVIPEEEACHGLAASGAPVTATFTNNTVQFCKFGIQARQGATVHASQNTIHDDYVSGFEVEDASTLTGSLNRLRNNGTAPPTSSDHARGGIVIADVNATVDFGNRLSGGEPGLNVFCGSNWSIFDIVAPSAAACPAAVVTAERNCFEAGEQLADLYGKVDDAYHGAVGIDPLCIDYGLTCDF